MGTLHNFCAHSFERRTATMLLPSGALLMLAALYLSVDLTGAEVSGGKVSNIIFGERTDSVSFLSD